MRDVAVVDEAGVDTRGRWKRYPECRDSGLDRLGEVPAHRLFEIYLEAKRPAE